MRYSRVTREVPIAVFYHFVWRHWLSCASAYLWCGGAVDNLLSGKVCLWNNLRWGHSDDLSLGRSRHSSGVAASVVKQLGLRSQWRFVTRKISAQFGYSHNTMEYNRMDTAWSVHGSNPGGGEIFRTRFRPALGPTLPLIQCAPGPFPGSRVARGMA
jgi:hypothetical protein